MASNQRAMDTNLVHLVAMASNLRAMAPTLLANSQYQMYQFVSNSSENLFSSLLSSLQVLNKNTAKLETPSSGQAVEMGLLADAEGMSVEFLDGLLIDDFL